MSRSEGGRAARSRLKSKANGPPLVVIVFAAGGGLVGFLIGMTVFAMKPHPIHWAAAVAGGIIGWAVGKIYFHFRGDID